MHFSILSILFLTSKVIADGQKIVDAIEEIASTTTSLNQTVGMARHPPKLPPILTLSTKLLLNINTGIHTASSSANLTLTETITIAISTQNLVSTVESTLDTIVGAKPKFDHLLFSPLILLNLVEEKSATDKFSVAIIGKIPADFQEFARQLVAPVDTAFEAAIAVYE
ncbi:hypothetical protein DID88_000475 [Monilinia fructigena]|uniref:Antigenic cell wall galactomannoprotein n=1 Tax=Monilinia fructigena TaxID=38457 RepID=A0A395II55_9HELO|nr:hypothetical protein DID88_000475 [Monilinia fructigena]